MFKKTLFLLFLVTLLSCKKEIYISQGYSVCGGSEAYQITYLDCNGVTKHLDSVPDNWQAWWIWSSKEKHKFYIRAKKVGPSGKVIVSINIHGQNITQVANDSVAVISGDY